MPRAFSRFSFWVMPMDDTKTTCFTPAALAASICRFCPSQSTCAALRAAALAVPPRVKCNFCGCCCTFERLTDASLALVNSSQRCGECLSTAVAICSCMASPTWMIYQIIFQKELALIPPFTSCPGAAAQIRMETWIALPPHHRADGSCTSPLQWLSNLATQDRVFKCELALCHYDSIP